jgi:chromosome segregation ATPase
MDHVTLTTAVCGALGFGVGTGFGMLVRRGPTNDLIAEGAAKDLAIEGRDDAIRSLNKELNAIGARCSELRVENRNKDEALGKLKARIADLEPLAERGRKAIEQHRSASRAGQAAQAAKRKSANGSNPVHITAPKKPARKSAIAG